MIFTDTELNPATYIRIHTDTLLRNYRCFAAGRPEIAPVVKANAYGHGAYRVAKLLVENTDLPFLVTASYQQASRLRERGIAAPILVIGYVPAKTIAANRHPDITFTAIDVDHLKQIESVLEKTQPIHLKVDTGMHRYGSQPQELSEIIELLKEARHVIITGVFSHLSDAFEGVNGFTEQQIDTFNTAVQRLTNEFASCQITHLASTSSHSLRDMIDANTERVGIGLFGLANFTDEFHTKPALSLISTIASLRTVSSGEAVGYSRTYEPEEERVIATIPAGYYEGVDRRLSNTGVVRVGEDACPIVGKVSMNATTVDVTDCSRKPQVGDEVELISADRGAKNSAANIAETINAVNYRITMQLPERLPRVMTS